ncbi:MAG TPA: lysophospholipid acyltransferase family protein [Thermoanaerobaculia bacterium]|nr:lysophospholipid acyltransferase family protein [Thermoanaerobaculia bacterium]
MTGLRESLRFYAGFAFGIPWLFLCAVLGFVRIAFGPRDRSATTFYARLFCGGLARVLGWRISVDRPGLLEESRPCVFVANHQSILDVVVFGAVVPSRTVAIGKKEIGWIPVFGWFFRAAGNITVDRGRSEQTTAALAAAASAIREERVSVWLMPEGHRNSGRELLPFKTGAFRLAAAATVPVVPLVAEPLTAIVDTRRRRTRPGTLRIRVLDPVTVASPSPSVAADAAAETRRRMQEAFDALRG